MASNNDEYIYLSCDIYNLFHSNPVQTFHVKSDLGMLINDDICSDVNNILQYL